ncbi:hypothetical protein ES703_69664 [subsurface metagenome]
MKFIHEVQDMIDHFATPKRWSYEPLIKQVLRWAIKIMRNDSTDIAEAAIRRRIESLGFLQLGKEWTGFATKPARAVQINALKWVVDEYDLESWVAEELGDE